MRPYSSVNIHARCLILLDTVRDPELYLELNSSTILTLDAYVTDDQPIDLIAWTVLAGSGVVAVVDSLARTAEITSIPGFQGTTSLLFIASDGADGADTATVAVTVLAPGQQAPLPAGRADFDGSGPYVPY